MLEVQERCIAHAADLVHALHLLAELDWYDVFTECVGVDLNMFIDTRTLVGLSRPLASNLWPWQLLTWDLNVVPPW